MAIIKLTQGFEAVVDDDAFDRLSILNWFAIVYNAEKGSVYARAKRRGTFVAMHRLIMEKELEQNPEMIVDHINRNPLDNRRINLRLVDHRGNVMNRDWDAYRKARGINARGISFCNHHKRWKAYINDEHLGWFDNEQDALDARKRATLREVA